MTRRKRPEVPEKLPHPRHAELALLRSIHDAKERVADVRAEILPSFFYDAHYRAVYEAMLSVVEAGGTPDILTLQPKLPAGKGPGENGTWVELLVEVGSGLGAAHAAHLVYNMRVVREQAAQREIIRACSSGIELAKIAQPGLEDEAGVATALAKLEESIFAIAASGQTGARSYSLAEALQRDLDALDSGTSRLPIGFSQIDYYLGGGVGPGELFVVAARPGVGKSTILLQMCRQIAPTGRRCLFFSLEMTPEALAGRFLANLARVERSRIRRKVIDAEESARIAQAVETARDLPITFVEDPALTVGGLVSRVRAEKLRAGVDAVFVDYLQLVSAPSAENRLQEVSKVSRGLKRAAKELGVPFFVAAQLSRAAETADRPKLHHLRESGTIEQDADQVLLLWPEVDAGGNEIEGGLCVDLAKDRDGETGTDRLLIEKAFARVADRSLDGIGVPLEQAFPGSREREVPPAGPAPGEAGRKDLYS